MDTKIDGDKVISYLLSGCRKGAFAVSAHKLHSCVIRTADLKHSTAEVHDSQLVEPLAGVDGVEDLCAIQDIIKNSFGFSEQPICTPLQVATYRHKVCCSGLESKTAQADTKEATATFLLR